MEFDEILYGLPEEPEEEKPKPEPPVAPEPENPVPAPPVAEPSIPAPPAEEPPIPVPPPEEPPIPEPPVPPAEEPPIPAPPAEEPPIPEQPPVTHGFAFTAQPVEEPAEPAPAEPAQTEPTLSGYTAPPQTNDYLSGTYRFGPGAFSQQSRDTEPIYGTHRGDYGYRTVRTTVQPAHASDTPAPTIAPAPKPKKKHTGLWIALALVLTLAAGGALGFFGHKLFAKPAEAQPAPASPTQGVKTEKPAQPKEDKGDLGGRIIRGDSTEYTAPADIYSQNVDAVVGISNESTTTNIWGQASSTASSGTGFIISEDGYILTNYHVAKGADKLTVTLSSGVRYDAKLVGYEQITCDVALLKIEAEGLPTVKLGDSDALQVGEQVCTIGNPLGELTYTMTVGYISAKERAINTDGNPINMLQTDAAINSGNSGGPLFDMAGNVVGIVTAKYSGSTTTGASIEGIGFAIPISNVVSILDDLQQYGYVTDRAYLGVMVADASEVRNANLPAGAFISSVTPGSCADRAGLQAGDVIVGIGDQVINSYEALVTTLNRSRAGETVEITYFRSGSYLKTEATFDARPREADTEEEPETQPTEPSYNYGFDNPFGFFFP